MTEPDAIPAPDSRPKKASSKTSGKKKSLSPDPFSVDAVFARMQLATGCRSLEELGELMGLTRQDFARAKKEGVVPAHWLYGLRIGMQLNTRWLLRAEGAEYRTAQELEYSQREMMKDMETCPVVVQVHRPLWEEDEPGDALPNFPVLRKTVLPRIYVPNGLLVFEQEPTPGLPAYEARNELIGVDTHQFELEGDCSFAFFTRKVVEFWHVGPLRGGGHLSQQTCREDLQDRFRFMGPPYPYPPNILGKIVWRFESVWRWDFPVKNSGLDGRPDRRLAK